MTRTPQQRYEASGKRPGKGVFIRLTDEEYARVETWRQPGEPVAAAIKRRLFNAD